MMQSLFYSSRSTSDLKPKSALQNFICSLLSGPPKRITDLRFGLTWESLRYFQLQYWVLLWEHQCFLLALLPLPPPNLGAVWLLQLHATFLAYPKVPVKFWVTSGSSFGTPKRFLVQRNALETTTDMRRIRAHVLMQVIPWLLVYSSAEFYPLKYPLKISKISKKETVRLPWILINIWQNRKGSWLPMLLLFYYCLILALLSINVTTEPKASKLTYINLFHIAEICVRFYYQSFLIPTASRNLNTVNQNKLIK